MVSIKVTANDDVLIVGREDFLEWKIATILTARDWWYVDVSDGQVVFTMDGYTLVFYIGVVFDGLWDRICVEGDVVLDKEG